MEQYYCFELESYKSTAIGRVQCRVSLVSIKQVLFFGALVSGCSSPYLNDGHWVSEQRYCHSQQASRLKT